MPPRWSRTPDRADPDYRRLDDRMTFATHVALFAAVNSGLWFFRVVGAQPLELGSPGGVPAILWITGSWLTVLIGHGVFIFAIARYSDSTSTSTQPGVGFQPKSKSERKKSTKG